MACAVLEFSPAPNKLFPTQKQPWQLPSRALRYPWRRAAGIRASSSSRRPRNGRKVKSDEELCSELKQFVSLIGLPEGHAPSMKVLSDHGRKDLANIVRRRGYRVIKELLTTSSRVDNNGLHGQDENGSKAIAISEVPLSIDVTVANESLNASLKSDDKCSMKKSTANSLVEQGEMDNTIRLQDTALAYNESKEQHSIKESGEHSPEEENNLNGPSVEATSSFKYNALGKSSSFSQHGITDLNIDNHKFDSMESIIISTLEEKLAKFMQNGELDASEYQSGEGQQEGGITMKYEDTTQSETSSVKEKICGTAQTPKGIIVSNIVPPEAVEHASQSHSAIEGEQLGSYDGENYLSIKAPEECKIELDRLRSMMHQKELELSRIKEQIEIEKNALSALQTKAEAEIRRVQTLISEKDAELAAVEESLSGLQEVNIQYAGEGEIVEVTGSFNGWRHRIKLDHQPSSPATDSIDSRKPRLWSTNLWLYPGKYEIKFIVDGHWRIDPQRESVYTRNGISNNILQVDG